MSSILKTIRKRCIGDETADHFDTTLLSLINLALATLDVNGVDWNKAVIDETAQWSMTTTDAKLLAFVQEYVYTSVTLIFDPPDSKAARDSMESVANKYLWYINSVLGGEN